MARWRRQPVRLEAPEWYRNYHPEDWDEPDLHERRMMKGNLGYPWPAELHGWHAERRWHEAKYAYRREHPALAEQELADIINRHYERRQGMG